MNLPARLSPAGIDLLRELAAVLGDADAARLMAAFAGRQIRVPANDALVETHPIVKAIGLEPAKTLSYYYHGASLEFPLGAAKVRRILELKAQGIAHGEIATMLGMTERSVRRHLADMRIEDARQLQLFSE